MGQRLQLQERLEQILGSRNVYFQPPASMQLSYPAIVYQRDNEDKKFAGNAPYHTMMRYQITVIDRNPDSLIPHAVSQLPLSKYSSHFTSDGLHHDVYSIYF